MPQSKTKPVHAGNSDYEGTILRKAPLHYWRLIEATGTNALDLGTGASNGTYTNTPTLNNDRLLTRDTGGGAYFTRTSAEYVDVGTLGNLGSGLGSGISISLWYQSTYEAAIHRLMGTLNSTGNDTYVIFSANRDADALGAGYVHMAIRDEDAKLLTADSDADLGINDGRPHHILATADGPNDLVTIYCDGVAATPVYGCQDTPVSFANFDRTMHIASVNVGATNNTLEGELQEFAIWNSILTQADATELYLVGRNGA